MDNPYAPPESVITPLPVHHTEAEQIRKAHLSHEASVKSIGTLFYLGAILVFSVTLFFVFNESAAGRGFQIAIGPALFTLGIIVFQWILGGGFRNLRPWVRLPAIIISVIGFIGWPIGTIISAYILYLMLSPKSNMIFSPEYRQIISATPHLRYRNNLLRTVLIVLLVIAAFGAIAFFYRVVPPR